MTSQILADYYVHSWDPFLVQFSEKWGVRWYGLAYVLGFFAAFLLIKWFARRGYSELKESQVADFITYAAILGVMLGGRLGYMLFYNWSAFIANPLIFFDFLGGGMASHGGILGLILFTWFYAKKTRLSWTGIGDNLVTVAPIGLFFGRIANFINGELYGRKTDAAIAMKFPSELRHTDVDHIGLFNNIQLQEIAKKVAEVAPDVGNSALAALINIPNQLAAKSEATRILIDATIGNDDVKQVIGQFLNPRHPSQLYEAFGEGLLLFIILIVVRVRFKNLYHGILTGLFFIIYAIARIVCENFREPDAPLHGSLTKGQFLSTFMILIGAGFIAWALKTKRTNKPVS